jgi:hypothetical protein
MYSFSGTGFAMGEVEQKIVSAVLVQCAASEVMGLCEACLMLLLVSLPACLLS